MSKRIIEKQLTIHASPEAVWKALTDAEQITGWFSPEARVTPGQGGAIVMSWGPGFEIETPIEIWEPGRRLMTGSPKRPIKVDYVLEGRGDTTVLSLVQSGFGDSADWDDEFDNTNRGWDIFLDNLRAYLKRRAGASCRQGIVTFPVEGPPEIIWTRLLGPRGFGVGVAAASTGTRVDCVTGAGDPIVGHVSLARVPSAFVLDAENLDARFYFTLERYGGQPSLFSAVYVYGSPTPKVDFAALHARLESMLQKAARGD